MSFGHFWEDQWVKDWLDWSFLTKWTLCLIWEVCCGKQNWDLVLVEQEKTDRCEKKKYVPYWLHLKIHSSTCRVLFSSSIMSLESRPEALGLTKFSICETLKFWGQTKCVKFEPDMIITKFGTMQHLSDHDRKYENENVAFYSRLGCLCGVGTIGRHAKATQ